MDVLHKKLTVCTICTFILLTGFSLADETLQTAESLQNNQNQAYNYNYNQDTSASATSLTSPYYPDYGYAAAVQTQQDPVNPFLLSQDRQGLETFITAPIVITAFIAALFGGFVSPFISQGLATMSQFEITLPSIRRRNVTSEISTTTETSRMLHFIHKMTDEDTRVKIPSEMMVLLYQLDCNKVLHMMDYNHSSMEHDTNTVSETEQFSDYWDNNLSSISMCGLPVSPVPLSSLWTPVLEDRPEKDTWERTKWTWETRTLEIPQSQGRQRLRIEAIEEIQIDNMCDDDYGEVVDLRLDPSLPNIVLDHKQSSHNHSQYHTSKSQQHSEESRHSGNENANMNFRYFPDILNNVSNDDGNKTIRQIPIIIINDNTENENSSDEEMEDYYENHKEWPSIVR